MIPILLRIVLCCLWSLTPLLCLAAARPVDIAVPDRTANYLDIARAIQHNLQLLDSQLESRIVTPSEVAAEVAAKAAQPRTRARTLPPLVITIGDILLPWAASDGNPYRETLAFYASSTMWSAHADDIRGAALFRDQPPARQLALAMLLFPDLRSAVVLIGDEGAPPGLMTLVNDGPVDISLVNVDDEPQWPRTLSQLMATHDLLLAHDDSHIYNRNTVRSLLLTTYRHGRVMIGPTRAFVEAGSLASAYTSTNQHLRQLRDMMARWLRQGRLSDSQYPQEYGVAVNRQVAASLGLRLPGEVELASRLRQVEEAHP